MAVVRSRESKTGRVSRAYGGSRRGLALYARAAWRYPMLSRSEETALVARWRQRGDPVAMEKLVNSHLRLVMSLASRYRGYGVAFEELVSQGHVGIMQAFYRFDPERGCRFATYAMWWIKATMREYILHSWSLVKIGTTEAQKKLFFSLRSMKARLKMNHGERLDDVEAAELARASGVRREDVLLMDGRLRAPDCSLNSPVSSEGGMSEWIDMLCDEKARSQEELYGVAEEHRFYGRLVREGLARLEGREREVVEIRHFSDEPCTLESLGRGYGLSRERVRQIEARALLKLRRYVLRHARLAFCPGGGGVAAVGEAPRALAAGALPSYTC